MVPQGGDIILAREAPVGEVGFVPLNQNICLGQRTVLIRVKNTSIHDKFLLYYFVNPEIKYELVNKSSGSVVEHLNVKDIREFEIVVPYHLPEQEAIAEVLSSLDDKIDLLHRQNKTLEQLAETLFRQWFVEEADESWEVGTIEDEFDFVMGQSPSGDTLNQDNDGMIFFQGRSDLSFRFPIPRVYTTSPKKIAKQNDTLVSVRAPVGDINMAYDECCLGRGVAAFRYKDDSSFFSYTYYKIRSLSDVIKKFEDNGTVFGSIGKDNFKSIEIVIPPIDLIIKFQQYAKPIDDKIKSNSQQIRTLIQLRDTLLPKLMSGEIKIEMN
jgi:type I restriction enzyme S subunit